MTHSRRIFLQNTAVLGGGVILLGACTSESSPPKRGSGASSTAEGARVITDPAGLPKTFKESPEFSALVDKGKLPPVAERVSKSPLVLKPLHGVGQYGGQIRRGFQGNGDYTNAVFFCSGPDTFLYWDPEAEKIVPNIARAYELSDDDKVLTLHLREGMKWSDGAPFTADDLIFWRADVNLDPDLAAGTEALRINGKEVKVEKVDDLTVRYVSPEPNSLLPQRLASWSDCTGMVAWSHLGGGGMLPKHYLSKFHPKYTSETAANKLAADAGFNGWVPFFKNRAGWHTNPDLPVVTPWVVTRAINEPPWEFAANPYSIWVDDEGQQLPYIPKITMSNVENIEVLGLNAAAGDYDFQDRGLTVTALPVLVRNEKHGNYTMHRAPYGGTDVGVRINLAYETDHDMGELLRTADFRRALSLGIDRQQIRESFFLGTGKPTAIMPADSSPYFPGPEWRKKWAAHDVNRAKALLDRIGLTAKDGQGYRLLHGSKKRIRLDIESVASQVDYPAIAEMIRQQWRQLGIDANVQRTEGNLIVQRTLANQVMLSVHQAGTTDPFLVPDIFLPTVTNNFQGLIGIPYAKWFASDGKQGTEPPKELQLLKDAMALYRKGLTAPEDERIRIGKQLYRMHADQVWSIGVIGSSISVNGIYLASNKLRNVPSTVLNNGLLRTPANTYPMTFYYA